MKMIRPLAVAASIALVLAACGSDDDSSADTTAATADTVAAVTVPEATDSTEPATTDATSETTETTPDGPIATLTVKTEEGDEVVESTVVECSIEDTSVAFTAQGETSEMVVSPLYGTYVGLSVTGDFEFEGSGDAALDGTTATITGSGALADVTAATVNFVLVADLSSC